MDNNLLIHICMLQVLLLASGLIKDKCRIIWILIRFESPEWSNGFVDKVGKSNNWLFGIHSNGGANSQSRKLIHKILIQ